jgi:hypothetical protein
MDRDAPKLYRALIHPAGDGQYRYEFLDADAPAITEETRAWIFMDEPTPEQYKEFFNSQGNN